MSKKYLKPILIILGFIASILTVVVLLNFNQDKHTVDTDPDRSDDYKKIQEELTDFVNDKHTIEYSDKIQTTDYNFSDSVATLMMSYSSTDAANVNASLLQEYCKRYSVDSESIETYKDEVEVSDAGVVSFWYKDANHILKVTFLMCPETGQVAYLDIVE